MKLFIFWFLLLTLVCGCTNNSSENVGNLGPSNSEADLNLAVNSGKAIVVEFYAEGLANSMTQRAIIEGIKPNYNGKAIFLKIDVNQHPGLLESMTGQNALPAVIIVDPSVHIHHSWIGIVTTGAEIERGISESLTGH